MIISGEQISILMYIATRHIELIDFLKDQGMYPDWAKEIRTVSSNLLEQIKSQNKGLFK